MANLPGSGSVRDKGNTVKRPSPVRYEGSSRLHESASCRTLLRSEESYKPTESKAYAMAMAALQEKVNKLEAENTKVKQENDRLRSEDQRRLREIEKLRTEMWERTERSNQEVERLKTELVRAKDLIDRVELHQAKTKRNPESHYALSSRKHPSSTHRELYSSSRPSSTPPLPQTSVPRLTIDSTDSTDGALDSSTRRLEREIEDYSKQYQLLVQRSEEQGADLLGLRVELNSLAAAMEAKSNHLAAIRRQRSKDLGAQL